MENLKTHDLSFVSKTVLTNLYGPFSTRSMVFLNFCAFFPRRYGANADEAPLRYIMEACNVNVHSCRKNNPESWMKASTILVDQNYES